LDSQNELVAIIVIKLVYFAREIYWQEIAWCMNQEQAQDKVSFINFD
jgi:hypothetical protein